MFRVLLIIIVLVVGYDAVMHQGANTREASHRLGLLPLSSVEGARELGERARE
ncbi:hypothetical protein [Bosea sp. (in: a-proteobacteria)]|uniref:hypothetical protein n=1 Tax=Bosea sp. (in: a-proteobacteria) TaxID=1871050 RepID=UPI00333E66AD